MFLPVNGVLGGRDPGHGNVVLAEAGNNRIRAVAERAGTFYGRKMTVGDVYSVAGGGNGTVILDGGNNRVRTASG